MITYHGYNNPVCNTHKNIECSLYAAKYSTHSRVEDGGQNQTSCPLGLYFRYPIPAPIGGGVVPARGQQVDT